MTNATSEHGLYIGLYLPGDQQPTPAALMKLQRDGLRERGQLAYVLAYLDDPAAIALDPLHLPLRRETYVLPDRLLRDGVFRNTEHAGPCRPAAPRAEPAGGGSTPPQV